MKRRTFTFFLIFAFLFFTESAAYLWSQESFKPERMYEITNHKTAVEIFANLPDVNVYLNGTYQGRTNLTIYDLTSGFYQLKLEKDGYEIFEEIIFVKNRYGQRFFVNMKK